MLSRNHSQISLHSANIPLPYVFSCNRMCLEDRDGKMEGGRKKQSGRQHKPMITLICGILQASPNHQWSCPLPNCASKKEGEEDGNAEERERLCRMRGEMEGDINTALSTRPDPLTSQCQCTKAHF